ncbi:cytochrome [Mycobacterium sp. IS-1590]|uniref:cytochrome P450 n=1 Tax=Mycobacterium sp. IS-1590 TaxID=1772286 RepID=UPI0007460F4D|nr:cytochrome P450 [Mycobacterium sp. IS-1590]KUI34504.1 cytochrome [Mycobacterium sp. IS-1590]
MDTFELAALTGPALTGFANIDSRQDLMRPVFRNTEGEAGYWMFTDYAAILEGLQHPEMWSSSVIVPTDPDPPYRWIPVMVDPPHHAKWRQVLAEYFSPGRVKGLRDEHRRLAAELVDRIAADGSCEFVKQVARVYPSHIFLNVMGMPIERLDEFLEWEDKMLHQSGLGEQAMATRLEGMTQVVGYFQTLIDQRRADPNPDAEDIVSAALGWTIDGEPVSDGDLLNCMLLLFMAGLDTVASQLSYAMLHLATHDEDRARVVAEPEFIPRAVEELLRVYPIVQTARKATRDMEFHGCPVKAGDMASFPLAAAGRDETVFPRAREVDLDRGITRHISFGAGPHRCLGSHLARQEMTVFLEQWHARIPSYRVTETPIEHAGQVFGLDSLQLNWES